MLRWLDDLLESLLLSASHFTHCRIDERRPLDAKYKSVCVSLARIRESNKHNKVI